MMYLYIVQNQENLLLGGPNQPVHKLDQALLIHGILMQHKADVLLLAPPVSAANASLSGTPFLRFHGTVSLPLIRSLTRFCRTPVNSSISVPVFPIFLRHTTCQRTCVSSPLLNFRKSMCSMLSILSLSAPYPQMVFGNKITETMKTTNQMTWAGRMNNIRSAAMEIINKQIIYK
ncbi:TnpV protein [Oscillospiraceae bacterium 50-58]